LFILPTALNAYEEAVVVVVVVIQVLLETTAPKAATSIGSTRAAIPLVVALGTARITVLSW
tara:strand:+ start:1364 stop:1546 length:183 start_codon:yes stop_codon:yes gene_type:complete